MWRGAGIGSNKPGMREAESGFKQDRVHASQKGIQRPRNAGTGGEDQHDAQQQQQDNERYQPPFFLLAGEFQKLFKQRPHGFLDFKGSALICGPRVCDPQHAELPTNVLRAQTRAPISNQGTTYSGFGLRQAL
jgi:hypothetical protein